MKHISEIMLARIVREICDVLALAESKAEMYQDLKLVSEEHRQSLHNNTLRTLYWVLDEAKRLNFEETSNE